MKRRFSALWARLWHFPSDADLQNELRAHLEMQAEENRTGGIPDVEAESRARLHLGNSQVVVEKVRDQEFSTVLEGWYRDFRLGVRALHKSRPSASPLS